MKTSYKYILLSILAVAAVSCNKSEIDGGKSDDITFEVKNGGMSLELTKGLRYNSESEFAAQTFGVYAWNNTKTNEEVYENESVTKTGGQWKPSTLQYWSTGCTYTFEAVYPKPAATLGSVGLTSLTTNPDPANLTFSYKVPTATMATEDNDFMLAYYNGTGTSGKAELAFTHPLTCVNFKAGTFSGIKNINSITLDGVYESGSCTVRLATVTLDEKSYPCYSYEQDNSDFTSLWTPAGSTSVTGTSTITPSSLSETDWNYNFLLIPQDTATKKIIITINVTDDSDKTYNVWTKINSGYWRAGYTNTYTVNYDAYTKLTCTLSSMSTVNDVW